MMKKTKSPRKSPMRISGIYSAAYIRVSSGMQVETGASLPSQLAEIRSYCQKHGLELLEEHIYTDAGESARTDDRPAFQAMISAARQKPPHTKQRGVIYDVVSL